MVPGLRVPSVVQDSVILTAVLGFVVRTFIQASVSTSLVSVEVCTAVVSKLIGFLEGDVVSFSSLVVCILELEVVGQSAVYN